LNNRDKLFFVQAGKTYQINVGEINEENLKPINIYNPKLDINIPIDIIF